MITELVPLDQVVLHNNKEIYERICEELKIAKSIILIATAWFTDPDLFAILENRQKEGISIELIIADNEENLRLDFASLEQLGAIVTKIKAVGYGMMHEKFCVIDNKIAMHGSYNWTLNARKNNNESIIVTNHEDTIRSLVSNFRNIQAEGITLENNSTLLLNKNAEKNRDFENKVPTQGAVLAYEKMLDKMIAAEVGAFDRETLRQQGFERSKANNGDHQVLYKGLDTLYSGFINDIDVVEDKKRRLLSKIEEQFIKTSTQLKEENEQQITTTEIEYSSKEQSLKNVISTLASEITIKKNKESEIKSSNIPPLERNISEIETAIKDSEIKFIKPIFKYTEVIPFTILFVGLLIYIFIFYSSAAYILLYSIGDAKLTHLKGDISSQGAQIFDSTAISKAINAGGSTVFFIILFPFIPLALSIIKNISLSHNQTDNNIKSTQIIGITGMIVVDLAIAYGVAKSVNDINELKGVAIGSWKWYSVLSETNFWLVFVFGIAGLVLFSYTYQKLIMLFQERNPDIASQMNKVQTKQHRAAAKTLEDKIIELKQEILVIQNEITQTNRDMEITKSELEILPITKAYNLQSKKIDLNLKVQEINSITIIYKTHVENDNVPISTSALKDRINVFLEGWNDYLHQEYAIIKASEKCKQAIEIAILWEKTKFSTNNQDSRIR